MLRPPQYQFPALLPLVTSYIRARFRCQELLDMATLRQGVLTAPVIKQTIPTVRIGCSRSNSRNVFALPATRLVAAAAASQKDVDKGA